MANWLMKRTRFGECFIGPRFRGVLLCPERGAMKYRKTPVIIEAYQKDDRYNHIAKRRIINSAKT